MNEDKVLIFLIKVTVILSVFVPILRACGML